MWYHVKRGEVVQGIGTGGGPGERREADDELSLTGGGWVGEGHWRLEVKAVMEGRSKYTADSRGE